METRIQIVAIGGTLILLLVVLELVRRRRLLERYALVWLGSTAVLLALGIWQGLLGTIADAIGVIYPPTALFVVAFGFILLLLLHFSTAVSRLTDQTKVLAQRLALTEQRQRELEKRLGESERPPAASPADDHPDDADDPTPTVLRSVHR
ncbi:MAG: hypothetical protein QOF65_2801 [Thermoleophilaceae bacterium]|nr:hypothetical protein [Thermoleophilaceae bacterium]